MRPTTPLASAIVSSLPPTPPRADAQPWTGRLPRSAETDLDEAQRTLTEQIRERSGPWAERAGFAVADDAGQLIGPFNALVLRPEHGRGYQRYVGADQKHSTLSATIREVVILTVGVAWQAAYEIYAHVAVARSAGLPEDVIDAIRTGGPDGDDSPLDPEQRAAHRFVDELVRTHRVADGTYATAHAAFGRDGVIDMVHLTGMYLATSALLNAFEIPAPEIPAPGNPQP